MIGLNGENRNILQVTKLDQYRTINELFEKSQSNWTYYTYLVLSSLIIASGLLLDNSFILVGGMLITPVLSPIMLIALGVTTGDIRAIGRFSSLVIKSFIFVIASAFLLSLIVGTYQIPDIFENTMRSAVLYFIVAIASGVVATFAWTKRETSDALAGIAIAVSLVPPLALIGIHLSILNLDIIRFYFLVIFFNTFGIIMGSIVVFSLMKFQKTEDKIEKKIEEEEKIEKK
jgi:uncharacterized hydrophobic protein (TIGR00271 family)